jgi:hypothetical protein
MLHRKADSCRPAARLDIRGLVLESGVKEYAIM